MRPREAAGAVNRATQCFVYHRYSTDPDGALYLPVTRVQAKTIVEHARANGVDDIDIEVDAKGKVYIGEEIELVDEEPEGPT